MKAQVRHTMEQALSATADLAQEVAYWTEYVTDEFAMAPTVVRQHGIDPCSYLLEGRRYSRHDTKFMLPWLNYMKDKQGSHVIQRAFYHIGGGHGDDVGYVPKILDLNFRFKLIDLVEVAREKTAQRIRQAYKKRAKHEPKLPDPSMFIQEGNVEDLIDMADFQANNVSGCKMGRLAYHYHKERMQNLMRGLAQILTSPGRIIILIHHLPEFNPGYQYRTSLAYELGEIMEAVWQVELKAEVLNQATLEEDTLWRYFDCQNLTWLAIGQP